MKRLTTLFVTVFIIIMALTACASPQPQPSETSGGAEPAAEFRSVKEALYRIKIIREGGPEKMSHPDDFKLYEKDHIYLLKEAPLPEFKQTSVMLITEGTVMRYRKDKKLAIFYWYQGYEYDETIENLTKNFSLERYKDTKFFFGKSINDIYIFWWENGDQFSFSYPADTGIAPEDVIDRLEVERYDV